MSWLYPALKVQRSALALSSTSSVPLGGVMVRASLLSSITCQVLPSLLGSRYWAVLAAVSSAVAAAPESGVTELDCVAVLLPTEFSAATEKYSGAPLASPVTVVCDTFPGVMVWVVPTCAPWALYVVSA